jgi:hypothetical protein
VTSEQVIAGAAFAQIRAGELGLRGLLENDVSLPAMKKMKVTPRAEFSDQVTQWKRVLERLAEDFLDGRAEVDPKVDACENCGLMALCRIREVQSARG